MNDFLSSLRRGWWSIELPNVRPHPASATYSRFDAAQLPSPPPSVDDELRWLSSTPQHEVGSLAESGDSATQELTPHALTGRLGGLPGARGLDRLANTPDLRRHLRSTTDCYFDLGDQAVEISSGGRLVHFLSDSQWVLHWLLYTDEQGREAVIVTEHPTGFRLGADDLEAYSDPPEYEIASDSFAEFAWRFWIENEIWFGLKQHDHQLSTDEAAYLDHYRRLAPAGA